MGEKTVTVDFGSEQIPIQVPDDAVVAEFTEPRYLDDPAKALDEALAAPHGAPPFVQILRPGMRVVIAFDDPTRPGLPWQIMLPRIVEHLIDGGIRPEDLLFICANGNHKKWSGEELRNFLGAELFNRFAPTGQIVNHDCIDPDGLTDLGTTDSGCVVEHNRVFLDADLSIYVGQIMAHTWGGYTGTGAVIGLASTRSILSHHNHRVVNHPDTTQGDHRRMLFRQLKADIHAHMEAATGKRVFYVNWVGGVAGKMSHIFAGYSPEVEAPAWEAADSFSLVSVPQADVLVIGLPAAFAYGSASNPLVAAIGMAYPPRVWLNKPVLREGGVVIGLNPSDGVIDHDTYPSYQEVIDLYDQHHDIGDLSVHQYDIATREAYLERYRAGGAYHPLHPFWLLYSCNYLLSRAGAVVLAGTRNPGAFRKLGITPARDFQHAWQIARRTVGQRPRTVIAPTFWSRRLFKFDVE